jgi:hypothetical protein
MDIPKDAIYSGPKVRKISLIEYTVKSFHSIVYDFIGVFGPLVGEVEIDHGSFQLAMAHVPLDEPGVGPSLQQMGCIALAQRVA